MATTGIDAPQLAALLTQERAPTSGLPASGISGGLPSWLANLSSDQQLAYYKQAMQSQFPNLNIGPSDYSGVDSGGEAANSGYTTADNAAYQKAAEARFQQYLNTLSPAEQANFRSLLDQAEGNSDHSFANQALLSMALMGVGGAAAGGAFGGAGAAADGAAGAGVAGGSAGTGNMALLESQLGTAGYGASSAGLGGGGLVAGTGAAGSVAGSNLGSSVGAQVGGQLGTELPSGMDLAADAAAGSGNNVGTAANAFSTGGGPIASTGSDAHFYQPQAGGIGVQDLGNMGGAGTGTIPTALSSGAGGTLQNLASDGSNASQLAKLLQGGVGTALAGAGAAAVANHNAGDLNIPDYKGAAQSQAASSRVDQTNPFGSLTYTQNGVDAQGNPVYKQNVSLNPADQANLDSARSGQSAALGGLNNSISGYADAMKALPGLYGDTGSQSGLQQQAIDAMYRQQTRLLDPQYQQQQQQLTSQLANQGITFGSQAYNTAMDNFARQRDSAYGGARDSSIAQGNTLANQLFGQNLQAHTTGMNDLSTQQNQYLNDANGLSNTVKAPTFQATSPATNYLGAAALTGQGNLNQYNAQTGNANSMTNGLFNLGGAVLSNPSWTNAIGSAIGNLFSTGGG